MAADKNNILIAARSHLYIADPGTAVPADATTAMGTGWSDVGYFTQDSLQFQTQPQIQGVKAAQSDYDVLKFQTSDTGTVTVDLLEWNGDNLKAAYGGGEITSDAGGVFKFSPPKLGERTEKMLCIELIPSPTRHFRFIFPRVFQTEGVTAAFQKTQEAKLPLKYEILGTDGADAWYLLTDSATGFVVTP